MVFNQGRSLILSLLILGGTQSENYACLLPEPLIDECKTLWEGIDIRDCSTQGEQRHVKGQTLLLWTMDYISGSRERV